MSKYNVVTGDTFARISQKVFGTEEHADAIRRANPGATLVAGTSLSILGADASDLTAFQNSADSPDEVSVELDGERFRYWETATINRNIDSFDTMDFGGPWEPENEKFRDVFRPMRFQSANVSVGGAPLFTGTGVGVLPVISPDRRTVSFSGYSLPGVLNDCTLPASAFPIEYNKQNAIQIAQAVAGLFGISAEIEGDAGAVFDRVAAEPNKKAFDFIAELTKQRNLILASTTRGALLLRRSVEPGNPVASLVEGSAPVVNIVPEFRSQEMYSHITGVQPSVIGTEGSQFTVENPKLRGVLRPLTFSVDDATDGDLKTAVEAKAGRMYGNAVSYSVEVAGWRDPKGVLWEPNTTLTLLAPGAMIYTDYEFLIKSVSFMRSASHQTAVLSLVLPGAYSGAIPEVLPWEE